MRIAVVGGGIAGLSAAIALAPDHDVTLFERSDALRTTGAGIVVSANAGRVLRSIGVDVEAAGRVVGASTIALADGRPLQVVDLAADVDRLGPTVAMTRADLHATLVDALPGSVDLRLGAAVDIVDVDASILEIDGGSSSFDLVVGADGINSKVRAASAGTVPVVPARMACWRTLVDVDIDEGPVEYLGAGQRLGAVGLTTGTYLYLVESAPPGALADVDVGALRERFGGFTAARPLLGAIETTRFDDLAEHERPTWGSDRAVLVGDAAHAMTPNLGQGASMAIEDAVVLARTIRGGPGWFDRYVDERQPRVRWVQLTSRRLGRVLHARSGLARRLRNGALRHTPPPIMRRQTQRLLAGGPVPAV